VIEASRQPLPDPLAPNHLEQLGTGSGLSRATIDARGYRTVTVKAELKRLGFSEKQCRVPALLVPICGIDGDIVNYQIRPDDPRISDGKPLKYESPLGSRVRIDVPPCVRSSLGDPSVSLWITEGSKKADAAAQRGLCCISLVGVWGWRGRNEHGGKVALPDFERVALNGREVILGFDSDVTTKVQVLAALTRLREFLANRGARVRIALLPTGANGQKTGLDDFLARGGTIVQLLQHVQDQLPSAENSGTPVEYFTDAAGTWWLKPTGDGEQEIKLANFAGTIVREINVDDGVEVARLFDMEIGLEARTRRVRVNAQNFQAMGWVLAQLGAHAIVEPGMSIASRLASAIQKLSDPITTTIYRHTGWRQIGGRWHFLHAGGAIGPLAGTDGPEPAEASATGQPPPFEPLVSIGPDGPVTVEMDLPPQLQRLVLPPPPSGPGLRSTAEAVLGLLDVGPLEVTMPLLLAPFRATLGDVPFSLFLSGPTGVHKSCLAALAQQFFGAGYDFANLPANWSSTSNALEDLAFLAKDTVLVVDDFVPPAGMDRGRLDAAADRLLRNSANRAARQRMRADGSLRPPRPSRALLMCTGELVPRGQSLRARMLVCEVGPGQVDQQRLTTAQADAAAGTYSLLMSAWIAHVGPNLEAHKAALRSKTVARRPTIAAGMGHGRTIDAICELAAMLEMLLEFLVADGAIPESRARGVAEHGLAALLALGRAQSEEQRDADPARRFLHLVASALASGRAHLCSAATADGAPVGYEDVAGWRREAPGSAVYRPRGDRICWIYEHGDVLLLPEAAEAAAQKLGRESGDELLLTGRSLRARLRDQGLLASTEHRGDLRTVVRRTIGGARHGVLHLRGATLWTGSSPAAEPAAQPAQTDATSGVAESQAGPDHDEDRPHPTVPAQLVAAIDEVVDEIATVDQPRSARCRSYLELLAASDPERAAVAAAEMRAQLVVCELPDVPPPDRPASRPGGGRLKTHRTST
jgi:hypothetical protein